MIMICQLQSQKLAMSKYLARLLSGKLYFSFRETVKIVISAFSKRFSQKAGKAEDLLRGLVTGEKSTI